MKKRLLTIAALTFVLTANAQDNPLWMRYCAISPDGQTIAFCYKGDIYTVPANGGKATQLTTNAAHDTHPIWSPDSKKIAFASNRQGSMDIYIIDKEGGTPQRLTTHSANEFPVTFKDAEHILYLSSLMPDAADMTFPSGQFPQVYEISTEGGRPTLFSSLPMEDISFSKDGKSLLYHDRKGYEDAWRKHHTSSITRDIWMCQLNGNEKTYRKLTSFRGEDRTPIWSADGQSFYYLSESKGSFNVFKRNLNGSNEKQLTQHTKHPVRFLSAASNGTLCYGYDGEIYTVKEGEKPHKVEISIVADKNDKDLIRQVIGDEEPPGKRRIGRETLAERTAHQKIARVDDQHHQRHGPEAGLGGDDGDAAVFTRRGVVQKAQQKTLKNAQVRVVRADADAEADSKITKPNGDAVAQSPQEMFFRHNSDVPLLPIIRAQGA